MKTILFFLFPILSQVLIAQEVSYKISADSLKSITINKNNDELLTGYRTQKQAHITSSVSTVQNHQLQTIPAGNVINQLQGLVPGLTVIGNGQPGETSKVFLRGIGTFSGSTPLFIVDGVPFDDLSLLNPNDVESVTVLKDGSSAAIYGGRAINGVIVIRTKKGEKGIHIQYNTALGWQYPGKGTADDLLTTKEYADLQWLVYKNDHVTEYNPLYGLSSNPSPVLPSWAANTDWYDALTGVAAIKNHDLTVSAGSENAKFYLGAGYYDQNGIILNTNTKRYSVRFNSEFTFFKKHFKIGENLNVSNRSGRYVPNLDVNSPIASTYRSLPIIPVYITEPVIGPGHNFQPGEFGGSGMAYRLGNSTNVVADRIRDKEDNKKDQQLAGNAYADVTILNGLTWRTSLGGTWGTTEITDFSYLTYENSENIPTSTLTETNKKLDSWVVTSLLSFERTFGSHSLDVLLGFERLKTGFGNFESTAKMIGSGVIQGKTGFNYNPVVIQSKFVNANYSFKDKYLIDISVRSDNSKIFPAISLGWSLSNESFLHNATWLNLLKFRASYGKTGNINSGNEYAITTNVGLDSRLFNNHLGLVVDWFTRDSRDLFLNISSSVYGAPDSHINDALMKNSGIDAALNFNLSFGSFRLNADLNLTVYHNEIGKGKYDFFDTGTSRIGTVVRNQVGQPISSYFGYQVAGLFSDATEIAGAAVQIGAQPGFFRFANLNGDALIDSKDRTFLGNPHPDFTTGFNLGLSYKRIDLSGLLFLSHGNEIYNFTKWYTDFWPSYYGQKSKNLLYYSWTEANKNTSVPMASNTSNFSTNTQNMSYYIEDGSYIKMKSLQLGYTFNEKLLNKVGISSLRLYLQAVNLFTLTKYSGLDPEIGGQDTAFGIDNGNYPSVRQLIIGLSLRL
jgi:TonB-dependent SusC/RagA subfamily outer membrane receptor